MPLESVVVCFSACQWARDLWYRGVLPEELCGLAASMAPKNNVIEWKKKHRYLWGHGARASKLRRNCSPLLPFCTCAHVSQAPENLILCEMYTLRCGSGFMRTSCTNNKIFFMLLSVVYNCACYPPHVRPRLEIMLFDPSLEIMEGGAFVGFPTTTGSCSHFCFFFLWFGHLFPCSFPLFWLIDAISMCITRASWAPLPFIKQHNLPKTKYQLGSSSKGKLHNQVCR